MEHILLITVNFHTARQTVAFCRDLRRDADRDRLSIVVADNSACFAAEANCALREELSRLDVQVIDSGRNLGYFGGANHALQEWLAVAAMPDCVIVANSDIEIRSPDFFGELVRQQPPQDVFVLAPDIARAGKGVPIDAQAFRENPMALHRFSSRSMRLRLAIKRNRLLSLVQHFGANRRRLRRRARSPLLQAGEQMYMMHGSFIVLLRSYFANTAGLAFPSFLFGEEIFVAEEVRRSGGRIVFVPSLQLNHFGGATTRDLGSAQRDGMEAASLEQLIQRYF